MCFITVEGVTYSKICIIFSEVFTYVTSFTIPKTSEIEKKTALNWLTGKNKHALSQRKPDFKGVK